GSLALASLNRACRNLVPTFPQRSPPWLLTTAACGGLRSAPDCRTRRVLLHLSYSCASPFGPALLVTQDPERTSESLPEASTQPCLKVSDDHLANGLPARGRMNSAILSADVPAGKKPRYWPFASTR